MSNIEKLLLNILDNASKHVSCAQILVGLSTQVLSLFVIFLMVILTRLYDKRIECRIVIDTLTGRFVPGTHQQGHQNFTKKLKTCVIAGGGHIKHKFLKHYQVFFITFI